MKIERDHGFTITELAIVIGILGIVLALSMGNIQSMIRNQRLTGATNQMITHLRLAREKSVAEGNNYVVTFRAALNNYQVWDDEGNDLIVGGQDIRRVFPMPQGTRIQNPQFFGANRVIFRPDGTCNASGSVEVRNDELIKTVSLLASTGKVTVTN
jgi:prepilin-type N-terminal cleavage/methylation domain-containing protein